MLALAQLTPQAYSLARHAPRTRCRDVRCDVSGAVSLGAGMVGGAVGVGVAYPLDTLKTKQQASAGSANLNAYQLTREIYRTEGLPGFYGGVSATMLGQAIIKGALFFVNGAARNALASTALGLGTLALSLAAAFSGAVTSFVMAPVERVKCVMQAKAAGTFRNPVACVNEVVQRDGVYGLCFRGLGATVLREIPACTFYLVGFDLAACEQGARPSRLFEEDEFEVRKPGVQQRQQARKRGRRRLATCAGVGGLVTVPADSRQAARGDQLTRPLQRLVEFRT